MLTVHHLRISQSERIVWLCEELGLDYDLKLYNRDPETRLAPPELKALHPMEVAPVITDGDLRRHMDGLLNMSAGQVMTANPTTIRPNALAEEAVAVMTGRITCLFVTDPDQGGQVQGVLHIHDCLRAGVI